MAHAQVASTNQAIVEFLKANGLSDNEISIGAPQMTDYRTNRYNNDPIPYNYSVSSVVTVSSTQVGLNEIKPEMIAEATENAREAAKKFADDSDSKIGKIKSARQGQFTIEDRDSYTPYIKEVRVVTSLTYFLED